MTSLYTIARYCPWLLHSHKVLNSVYSNSSVFKIPFLLQQILKQIHMEFVAFETFWFKWHHCTPLLAINYFQWLLRTQMALNSILVIVQFFWICILARTVPETNPQVICSICHILMLMATLYTLASYYLYSITVTHSECPK